ncbi:histidine phosphatase family protein [Neisseria musculi]|uniref:phosphoglycerate mutase (2,3-diphosphoglycerate-dependent) n=1 Tax=Neisseria musculi TaxID=1815583 RepID=A0A7H1M953_9NEIS|nr:histidine phosphatase family protein [Neisseria musculi]QNT58168.1 histidine phosphatase super family protein [Neisseria musculi]
MEITLYLVRHGKTVFNTVGRLQGWSDSPLTQEGRAAASALGSSLKGEVVFDAAFASTSPRALETARLVLQAADQAALQITPLEALCEYCFGGFEGEKRQTVYEMAAAHQGEADVEAWLNRYRHGTHNILAESVSILDPLKLAETERQFVGRLQKGMNQLVENVPKGGNVLLVSHGMAITALLKSIDSAAVLYRSVKNTTVLKLYFNSGKWRILSKNIQYS